MPRDEPSSDGFPEGFIDQRLNRARFSVLPRYRFNIKAKARCEKAR